MVSLCMELIFRLTLFMHCRFIRHESECAPLKDFILKKIIPIEIDVRMFIFKFPFLPPAGAEWSGASTRDRL